VKKLYWTISAFIVLIALGGCIGNQAPYFSKSPEWSTQNVDPTYWSKSVRSGNDTAYRSFRVYAADPNGGHDLDLITVTDPDGNSWVLLDREAKIESYDEAGGYWGGWFYFYPTIQYKVLLGEYTVVLKDRSGIEVTQTMTFTSPGGVPDSGFLYSDEYGVTVSGTRMLQRATVTSGSKKGSITIAFTVGDSNVYDGQIWFYDGSANLIAESEYFGGGSVITDGTTNTIIFSPGDLDLGGYSWSDIAGFHVILVDGAQYAPAESEWDHRSISKYTEF
jgi:hypothetical protein